MSIRQPDEYLELGTHVRWHHRAGVARKLEQKRPELFAPEDWSPWILTREAGASDVDRYGLGNEQPVSPLKGMTLTDSSINKTVVCWPEEGSGVVIGLVRKGIGVSVRGYESGYETPEWNPGYFAAKDWVWLYAVKGWINGTNFYYAPMWAVRIDEGGTP